MNFHFYAHQNILRVLLRFFWTHRLYKKPVILFPANFLLWIYGLIFLCSKNNSPGFLNLNSTGFLSMYFILVTVPCGLERNAFLHCATIHLTNVGLIDSVALVS